MVLPPGERDGVSVYALSPDGEESYLIETETSVGAFLRIQRPKNLHDEKVIYSEL